jgi:hypothetical protein
LERIVVRASGTGAPWEAPGWRARVLRWVRAQLKGTVYGDVRAIKEVREWSLSCVLRVRTDGGVLYFKVVPNFFASEAAITMALARLFPESVPTPVAVDTRRNWMLLPDLGPGDMQKGTPLEEWCEVVRLHVGMQVECIERVEELLRVGCGDRRLAAMPGEIDALCADDATLSPLEGELSAALKAAAPRLKELCARLGEYRVPETLTHGDLHGGNMARVEGRHVIYDWTDAAISHPFLDLSILLNWHVPPDKPDDQETLIAAYLEKWQGYDTPARLREAVSTALPLSSLYQVLSYRRMLRALGGAGWEDLGEEFGMWIERMLRSLERTSSL